MYIKLIRGVQRVTIRRATASIAGVKSRRNDKTQLESAWSFIQTQSSVLRNYQSKSTSAAEVGRDADLTPFAGREPESEVQTNVQILEGVVDMEISSGYSEFRADEIPTATNPTALTAQIQLAVLEEMKASAPCNIEDLSIPRSRRESARCCLNVRAEMGKRTVEKPRGGEPLTVRIPGAKWGRRNGGMGQTATAPALWSVHPHRQDCSPASEGIEDNVNSSPCMGAVGRNAAQRKKVDDRRRIGPDTPREPVGAEMRRYSDRKKKKTEKEEGCSTMRRIRRMSSLIRVGIRVLHLHRAGRNVAGATVRQADVPEYGCAGSVRACMAWVSPEGAACVREQAESSAMGVGAVEQG
ncbi:hypothetical protein C8R43DRAFT_942908 [Mycena crocata]|nr:hypothetical protein C8R43DRAFT_942908 [Mycena crocata]